MGTFLTTRNGAGLTFGWPTWCDIGVRGGLPIPQIANKQIVLYSVYDLI